MNKRKHVDPFGRLKIGFGIFCIVVCCSCGLSAHEEHVDGTVDDGHHESDFMTALSEGKPIDLEQCIDFALQHAPSLKKREIEHEDRLFDNLIERALFDINLDASTGLENEAETTRHSLTAKKKFVGGIDVSTTGVARFSRGSTAENASWSVRISKKILGSGTYWESRNKLDDSVLDIAIALNRIHKEKRRLVFQVKRSFYQIIRDTQSLSIQERRLERAKTNLEHARERERPLDIITAEIQVPENELNVIQRERAIEAGVDRLKEIIGLPIGETLELDLQFEFEPVRLNVTSDILYSLENQEDFLNNRLEREKIDADLRVEKKQIFPDVSIAAEHTQNDLNGGVDLNGEDEQFLGLEASWAIGSRRDIAQYRKQKNQVQINEVDYYSLMQEKTRRLRDLGRQLEQTERSLELQENRLELVEFQVELFKDRWENGEIDILELVRSQNSLEDTKVEMVNLKARYLDLLAEYYFEVGK